jgi:hypothetical protein
MEGGVVTTSDIERQLTSLFHQHAEEAMNTTDTTTELHTFHARVDQDTRGRHRQRMLMATAAAAAVVVGIGAIWLGSQQSDSQPPTATSPSESPLSSPSSTPGEPSAAETPQTPGSVVHGFDGAEGFPMRFVVPEGFSDPSAEGGTRGYAISGTSGAVGAFVISTVTDDRATDLPADLAAHIREGRDDLLVSNVRATEVGGRTAQSFTLTQKPGTAASDLWCARAGSCYKLLEEKPMDITVVRTRSGMVLFEVEYLPRDRTTVQGPVQEWLDSVRWE